MICNCGGIFLVEKIHESQSNAPRLCDIKCAKCGTYRYYQPYDPVKKLNLIPKSTEK